MMGLMKRIVLSACCLLLLAVSCEKKNGEGEVSLSKIEKIKKEVDLLKDSTDNAWKAMNASDDLKFADIKRLLDEVSYTAGYNVALHDSVMTLQKQVLAGRYDAAGIRDSKSIDAYDQATDAVLKATFKLVNSTPNIESHPLAKTLMEDIMTADNNLVLYRARYDRWAKQYNDFLEKHEGKLKKAGPPYDALQKKPTFSL